MNTGRSGHTATLLMNGKVLVTGGVTDSHSAIASAELYNPSTDTWTIIDSMQSKRYEHTASLLPDGKVLVTGGTFDEVVCLQNTELNDPITGNWSNAGDMLVGLRAHTASVLENGDVLICGGVLDDNLPSKISMLYTSSKRNFKSTDDGGKHQSLEKVFVLTDKKMAIIEDNFKIINDSQLR